MGKVCAIKNCDSGRKSSRKKKKLSLSYFQATESSKRLENWTKCLGIDLKSSDYICQLHFKEEDVKSYDTIIIGGKSNILPLIKKKLSDGALPTLEHQSKLDSELPQLNVVPISKISRQINIKNDGEFQLQKQEQQQILSNKDKGVMKVIVEQHSYYNPINIQESLDDSQEEVEQIIPDQNQEALESINSLRNLIDNVSMLPEFWSFSYKPKALEFMRIDPLTEQIKFHVRVNEDLTITIICSNNQKVTTDTKITALNDVYNYLKSAEKWPVCVGTLIDSEKYSESCKGIIVGDESYRRMQMNPRCKSCRHLRNQLQNRKGVVTSLSEKSLARKRRVRNDMKKCKRLKTTVPSTMDEPAAFRVCRICLVMDEEMYHMSEHGLSDMYKQLTGSMNCTKDKLPQMLCFKCAEGLLSAHSLREMALKTTEILMYKFDVSKHTITLKDIQPVSKQMKEIRNQELKFPIIPKPDVEFDSRSLKVSTEDEPELNIKCDLNDFTITNGDDDEDNEDDDNEDDDNEEDDDDYDEEMYISDDEIDNNDGEVITDNDELGDNDEMFYEFTETLDDDFNIDEDDIDEKVLVEQIYVDDNECEVLSDEINRKKGKKQRQNVVDNDSDLFKVTKLSYEEQVLEVEKRKESDSYKEARFQCTICYKGFGMRSLYENHMEVHNEKSGPFECCICRRRYKMKSHLKDHLWRQHYKKYECKLCSFVSKNKSAADNHREFHAGRTYSCPHCDSKFNQFSTYMGHLRIKHVWGFVCELCGYTFLSKHGLAVHKNLKHKLIDDMELNGPYCVECDVTFLSDEVYNRHLKLSSKHINDSDTDRPRNDPIIRNQCGASVKGFKEVEVSNKTIECEQCGIILHSVRSYKSHFKKHHIGIERCQYLQRSKMNFMCEQCGRRFSCTSLLEDHLLFHSGKSNFRCDTCGKKYSTKMSLSLHIRTHTAAHKCPICEKTFNSVSNRDRHILIHKQHRDFKCEYCDKAFKSAIEKRTHTEHVHLRKPWPKRNRSRTSSRSANITKHIETEPVESIE